ncbi:MAG TPA: hypothetical protein VHH88_10195 [Verrucomicrobiae bacterium]|nr:hypothetical protein [Verrucomicrobiae bacterium]
MKPILMRNRGILATGLFLFVAKAAMAASSESYQLTGTMECHYFKAGGLTNSEKIKCCIQKSGEFIRIGNSPAASPFPSSHFLADNQRTITFVEFTNHAPDLEHLAPGSPWNNGAAWVSANRFPRYRTGKLSLLWLMSQGQQAYACSKKGRWLSPIGNVFDPRYEEISNPATRCNAAWPDGFSEYSETIEDKQRKIIQQVAFEITSWTNIGKATFPAGFEATIKRSSEGSVVSEQSYKFSTETISNCPIIDMSIPKNSSVDDKRFVTANGKRGVYYRTTNGMVLDNPLLEARQRPNLAP